MVEQAGALPGEAETSLADSRTQFVASLGRRLDALRQALVALEQAPRSAAHRDHLRRRIHAFGAAAGVLGFDRVFDAFREAEATLGRAGSTGPLGPIDLGRLSSTLDLVPSLVLGAAVQGSGGNLPARAALERRGGSFPVSVLAFGAAPLVESLGAGGSATEPSIECELTDDVERAEEIVRVMAPDVAVIDADRKGARELMETLAYDPLLDPVRLVAVGTFDRPEAAASLVALGVARVLPKPVSPDVLRRTVLEVARERMTRITRIEPLGDLTVEALGDRLAQEIRRGLVDAVRAQNRGTAVSLGDGTDVLAALWASVARVRELVTLRSGGSIRFEATGPEGAVPLAPWMDGDRQRGTGPGEHRAGAEVSLSGRVIVVADDDPAVTWFLSGLLKSAGAEVLEALDGTRALELVRARWPDVVVSDILMPGLDGFSLCREIKRDIALSDIPVILLSWKEDLLQRVHELGAQADGYLRKEATASAVVQRVREVLLPRARVEARIASGGEARGRLDGLTPRLILELVCRRGQNAQVSVRDAAFLYEVDVRGGRVRRATRTTSDGKSERGEGVVAAFLGVRAGRFSVKPDHSPVSGDVDVTLPEALVGPIRRARAALAAMSDLGAIARIDVDLDAMKPYSSATPEAALAVVRKLAEGASPQGIVAAGAPNRLLEAVLSDLVLHGAVRAILGAGGEDLWATEIAEAPTSQAPPLKAPVPPPRLEPSRTPPPAASALTAEQAPSPAPAESASALPAAPPRSPPEPEAEALPLVSPRSVTPAPARSPTPAPARATTPSPAPPPVHTPVPAQAATPSPVPPPVHTPAPPRPEEPEPDATFVFGDSIFPARPAPAEEPKEGSRSQTMKALAPPTSMPAEPSPFEAALRSLPEELTPKPKRESGRAAAAEPEPRPSPGERAAPQRPERGAAEDEGFDLGTAVMSALGEDAAPAGAPAAPAAEAAPPSSKPKAPPAAEPRAAEPPKADSKRVPPSRPAAPMAAGAVRGEGAPRASPPSSKPAQATAAKPAGGGAAGTVGIVLVVLVAAAASFGLVSALRSVSEDPKPVTSAVESPVNEPVPGASAELDPSGTPAAVALVVDDLDLPPGLAVEKNRGLLEVDVPGADAIAVDGVPIGEGAPRQMPLAEGQHEVRITGARLDVTQTVGVRLGRRTRIGIKSVQ